MAETKMEFSVTLPGGKIYSLRDDGYRVYARLVDPVAPEVLDGETCLFEYKYSDCIDAPALVDELLVRASIAKGRDEINAAQSHKPSQSWKHDGTGFHE